MLVLTSSGQQQTGDTRMATETESEIVVTTAPEAATVDAVAALGVNSASFIVAGVTIDGSAEDLAPVNLTVGVINPVVADLQQRP